VKLSQSNIFFLYFPLFFNSGIYANQENIEDFQLKISNTINCDNDFLYSKKNNNYDKNKPRSAPIPQNELWPEGKVYYKFSPGHFNFEQVSKIKDAMRTIMELPKVSISFEEATQSVGNNYILITRVNNQNQDLGCSANVGRVHPNSQYPHSLTLGTMCVNDKGTVLHELLHVLGFYHEQSREDRDDHVSILWENISINAKYNFSNYKNHNKTRFTPYDYDSIMHYDPYGFSQNLYPTIIPKECLDNYRQNPYNYYRYNTENWYGHHAALFRSCPKIKEISVHKNNLSPGDIYSLQMMYPKGKTEVIDDKTDVIEDNNGIPKYDKKELELCLTKKESTEWKLEEKNGLKIWTMFEPSHDGKTCTLYYQVYTYISDKDEWKVEPKKEYIISN
jgi:hypothetical protein